MTIYNLFSLNVKETQRWYQLDSWSKHFETESEVRHSECLELEKFADNVDVLGTVSYLEKHAHE